ncbi:flagellin lysine-N-methylase, partial [Clostridium botulinum]
MKNKRLLQPIYVKNFKCIGKDCEDSCCIGWKIHIDKSTIKKYKNVRNKDLKKRLDKYIKRNRHSVSDKDYGKIKLLENGDCPFLNSEKLCDIFINLGEDKLSRICTQYPRIYNEVEYDVEKSLTVSCPEAARLVLLSKSPMEFEEIQFEEHNVHIDSNVSFKNSNRSIEVYKNFWNIRIFIISVLQNRQYSLDERLMILAFFYKELSEENKNVKDLVDEFEVKVAQNLYKDILLKFDGNLEIKISMLIGLLNINIENNIKFADFTKKYLQGLDIQDYEESELEDIKFKYKLIYEKHYKNIMKDNSYILENYLVNYVFQNLMPLSSFDLFEECMVMVIYYSIIRIYLLGLREYYNEKFSEEVVVVFLQQFTKTIIHNKRYS